MKSKNIKVTYASRYSQKGSCSVPKIRIEGKWLEELGFLVGSTVAVEYEEGSIRIRPLTEQELAFKEQQDLKAQLKHKEKELLLMQASYETLSKVAEASQPYGEQSVSKSK